MGMYKLYIGVHIFSTAQAGCITTFAAPRENVGRILARLTENKRACRMGAGGVSARGFLVMATPFW